MSNSVTYLSLYDSLCHDAAYLHQQRVSKSPFDRHGNTRAEHRYTGAAARPGNLKGLRIDGKVSLEEGRCAAGGCPQYGYFWRQGGRTAPRDGADMAPQSE
ncbi:hypothetical protein MAPG_07649 [Magnaporthiopsis poae ATCC 64411]|uniref:Uncharacterized protein n=1 Tax=Magnaporthiopsis poae (strain ATCC 64411 / 73-15) TaxID=644358 RepID=A0A0C4E584_MAGP6|nr:hypothetical protein MAPG_07649 [Magnaporthiopsis poae ATCC 64411]